MVSVSLYDRSTVPTITSVTTSDANYARNSTTYGAVGSTYTVLDGETAFFSCRAAMDTYTNDYAYCQVRDDLGNDIGTATAKYRSGYGIGSLTEWKNTTGATRTLQAYMKKSGSGYGTLGGITRMLIMTDADLAKWERVNLPTTRHRKYAVDKYYLLAKWTSGSFNIDGYSVDSYGGGIVTVDVETIVSSTELTGSGSHFFQVTGKGFTTTN